MPRDVIPIFDNRQARFDCYEQYVSEAIEADKEGETFVVGVRGRDVVAVSLANERENLRTFMDVARQYPAVRAELDGGYERFLSAIDQSAHKEKVGFVASALAGERSLGVPLRSRRILDVTYFLALNAPIPAFSEGELEERTDVAPDTAGPTGAHESRGTLPSAIDTAALAERWLQSSRRELPKLAWFAAPIDVRMVRQHFRDAVGSAVKCLEDRQDPRAILAHWQSQVADMSGSEATPEFAALGEMSKELTAMLEALPEQRAEEHEPGTAQRA